MTLDQNGQVRRWDLGSQHEDEASRRDLPGGPGAQVRVLSPDGRLAALAEGNKVRVYDTATGHEKFAVDSANPSYRRSDLLTGRQAGWSSSTTRSGGSSTGSGEVIASLRPETSTASNVSPCRRMVSRWPSGATVTSATGFHLSPRRGREDRNSPGDGRWHAGETLGGSALTADGGRLAVGAKLSGNLAVFDAATGRLIARHSSAHASPIAAIAFSGDGTRLATADAEGTIKIWADLQKLDSKSTALLTLKGHQGAINTVGFSSDGKRLVTASADKTARVWDLENAGAAIRPLEGLSDDGDRWRDPLFAGWPTDRRGQRPAVCVCGTPPRGDSSGNCHPAKRVESPASHSRRPTTVCWLSGTADKRTFLMLRCGTSMPERSWRG